MHKLKLKPNSHKKQSLIVAQIIISESELIKVLPDYSYSFEVDQPEKFKELLWGLGLDVNQRYVRQDNMQHRNRFNAIVLCSRWLGEERQDKQWIESGYASREAVDKYSCSSILDDLYRQKNMTADAQAHLEERDKYTVIDETLWKN